MQFSIIPFLLLISCFGYSQESLPVSLFVEVYLGTDYRSNIYGNGSKDSIDSLCFNQLKEHQSFYSGKVFKTRKVHVYTNDDYSNTQNINSDSTITTFEDIWVSNAAVSQLVSWMNLERYEPKIFQRQYDIGGSSELAISDTLHITKGLGFRDFDIRKEDLRNECACRNIREAKKFDCNKIDIDSLFDSVLNEHVGHQTTSSYSHYVKVRFKLGNDEISLIQEYSRDFNIKWRIIYNNDNDKLYVVLNPYLNKLINQLLPRESKIQLGIMDFSDPVKWIDRNY